MHVPANDLLGAGAVVRDKEEHGVVRVPHGFHLLHDAARFAVYAVDSIQQALGLFTGMEPGRRDARGNYEPDSVLGRAVQRAGVFWKSVAASRTDGVRPSLADVP